MGQHTTGKASLMQDRFKQLEHKLHNRPSKADLEHLNILKGSNGVEPNIHAAQQVLAPKSIIHNLPSAVNHWARLSNRGPSLSLAAADDAKARSCAGEQAA